MIPYEKSRFCVPLCRHVVLPLVKPIIEDDVQLLETKFSNGYREGDHVLYMSIAKNDGSSLDVTDETVSYWINIGNAQVIVLRNNWIRTKTCIYLKIKCFVFRRVTIE